MRSSHKKNTAMLAGKLAAAVLVIAAAVLIFMLLKDDEADFLKPYEAENKAADTIRWFIIRVPLTGCIRPALPRL